VIPDLSVVWVIALVLVLSVILDRLLLRPVTRVMQERAAGIRSACDLAELTRAKARTASEELETKARTARAELYRQMDERRRAALAGCAEIVGETRREVERSVADATARIETQAAAALVQLEHDADLFAAAIVERVLGRKAS
jgi:F-type H+-transporting ATPase subunit b